MKSLYRKVDAFDGQTITVNGKPGFELGGFLGGGAAGVVYEGADVSEQPQVRPVAIKILNPVGYRLAQAVTLRRCVVARRGQPVSGSPASSASMSSNGVGPSGGYSTGSGFQSGGTTGSVGTGSAPSGGVTGDMNSGGSKPYKLGPEHVWWLVSPNTKQVLAAYIDPRHGNLVELPLPKCIEIWGLNPQVELCSPSSTSPSSDSCSAPSGSPNRDAARSGSSERNNRDGNATGGFDLDGGGGVDPGLEGTERGAFEVQVDGMGVSIPWLPPKYVQWLSQRRKVKREINNMGRVGGHRHVVELLSVLELLQDSKSTLFLVLELVTGGELLEHIRLLGERGSSRAREASALTAEGATPRYFRQLLSGLAYCHRQGICHRDLSPSNLLLAESPQGDAPPELKVADFGLSACCSVRSPGNENHNADGMQGGKQSSYGLPDRVKSIVGSPHYMAPEVTNGHSKGYDGFKADAWSCGVVLYTMLTASVPFERDLTRCPRFKGFKKWTEKHSIGSKHGPRSFAPPLSSSPRGVPRETGLSPSSSPSLSPTSPSPVPPLWLFPPMIPIQARVLLVSLLVPNPARRITVEQALEHPWLVGGSGSDGSDGSAGGNGGVSNDDDRRLASPEGRESTATAAAVKPSPPSLVAGFGGSSKGFSKAAVNGLTATPSSMVGRGGPGGRAGDAQRQDRSPTALDRGSRTEGRCAQRTRIDGVDGEGGKGDARKREAGSGDRQEQGWRGWKADASPQDLMCGSMPSTTSFP